MDRAQAIGALEREGFFVTEWRDEPGTTYEPHTHQHREVRVVLEGSMTIETDGTNRTLRPGDRLEIAPNEEHSAVVGPDGAYYLAAREMS